MATDGERLSPPLDPPATSTLARIAEAAQHGERTVVTVPALL
jgi:hypothetical protein